MFYGKFSGIAFPRRVIAEGARPIVVFLSGADSMFCGFENDLIRRTICSVFCYRLRFWGMRSAEIITKPNNKISETRRLEVLRRADQRGRAKACKRRAIMCVRACACTDVVLARFV